MNFGGLCSGVLATEYLAVKIQGRRGGRCLAGAALYDGAQHRHTVSHSITGCALAPSFRTQCSSSLEYGGVQTCTVYGICRFFSCAGYERAPREVAYQTGHGRRFV